jgi:uncharacterized protein
MPRPEGDRFALPVHEEAWGEGRGKGQPQSARPAQAPAPHPNPLPASPPAKRGQRVHEDGPRARGERGSRGVLARALLLFTLLFCITTAAIAEPRFPPLTGRIVDEAALLSPEDERALEADLKALEEKSTDQLVVYTTKSLQGYDIADIGYRLGRFWQIGQKGKDNGAILIVAPSERKVRIEVGRGLEPQLTDAMSKLIIENAILPAFRRGDFAGGVKAGVRDIRDVLLGDAEAVKARARSGKSRSAPSGGTMALTLLVVFVVLALTIVWMQSLQTAHPARVGRDRRLGRQRGTRHADSTWGSSAGSWGWSSGGGSSDGGGGGFSGGGGDFGGGGASGSW